MYFAYYDGSSTLEGYAGTWYKNEWHHKGTQVKIIVNDLSTDLIEVHPDVYISNLTNISVKDFYSTTVKVNTKWAGWYIYGTAIYWHPCADYVFNSAKAGGTPSDRFKIFFTDGTTTEEYIITLHGGQQYRYATSTFFNNFASVYNNIRQHMITSANNYWNYLHSLGYYNLTDLPEDYIPVYPDVTLDDLMNIANVSDYNETFPIYFAMMEQLTEQLNNAVANNESGAIDWRTLDIGNFSGKKAKITLREATATAGNGTIIINNHLCYIIPYEKDLTLTTNKTYAITLNTTLPAWADELINHAKLGIYDLTAMKWYLITVDENTYKNLTIHELYEGNQTVDIITLKLNDVGNITYSTWGFGYIPTTYIPLPSVLTDSDSDIIGWLEEHKGLVIIALIVLGVILTGSSRKGTGGHTLGLLLLVTGIGMAFYFYILPAWNSVSSFWDKITFWD